MIAALIATLTLTQRVADIAKTSGGHMGVCVQGIEEARREALNGDEPFPMQSVCRLPIAMAILDAADHQTLTHKTGTDATRDGLTRATNDIGIVTLPGGRHVALAVFVKDSTSDETARDRAIAAAAPAAYDAWVSK